MLHPLLNRLRHGTRTVGFPRVAPSLPGRFRGLPVIDADRCPEGCARCLEACPTAALGPEGLDLGKCLFCAECVESCPEGALRHTAEYRLSARQREQMVRDPRSAEPLPDAELLSQEIRRRLGRSLKLRQVSAGGCNGCEQEVAALSNVVFDLPRFGIDIVASPRHADGILLTGPVTENMRLALEKTYAAVPDPKIVVAVGACAISGGPYAGHSECVGTSLPIDLYVPGCPPHPYTLLHGLLGLLGKLEGRR